MKPMLACNWDEKKIRFPAYGQPKIDGVRGLNFGSGLTGRSLKKFKNIFTTARFSGSEYAGLDGELIFGSELNPALCRNTTQAVGTILGQPDIKMIAFDFITEATRHLPYSLRYSTLAGKTVGLPNVYLMESVLLKSMGELLDYEEQCLNVGYEGIIVRDPKSHYKEGRATVTKQECLKIKRFSDSEATVLELVEAHANENEATINALGKTERSSHAENKSPKGVVGALKCRCAETGAIIMVGPGTLTAVERLFYWNNPQEIIGKLIKYKHFKHGVKSKPRFPTFLSLRDDADYE